jgi:hypothetical protein
MKRSLLAAVSMCVLAVSTGCHGRNVTSTPDVTFDRSRKLSILAAAEASQIADADSRLTRQLNIADQVKQRYTNDDALAVLDEASKTLHAVGPSLDGFARISGWVSVSQLARASHGNPMAETAAREAQRELEALPELGERCQYVLSVAEEISHLQGNAPAIELLTKGGQWAKSIDDSNDRRAARLAFAIALFNLNAYEGGVASLRGEGDPAWASDTMLALASRDADNSSAARKLQDSASADESAKPQKFLLAAPASPTENTMDGFAGVSAKSGSYGKTLGYDAVFRGASHSRR